MVHVIRRAIRFDILNLGNLVVISDDFHPFTQGILKSNIQSVSCDSSNAPTFTGISELDGSLK